MKRIALLSIFFAALIEFAIERARFDLWIVAVVAIVTLLWNLVGRRPRADGDSKKRDHANDKYHNRFREGACTPLTRSGGARGGKTELVLKGLSSRRDRCIALPQGYIKPDECE